ncbi:MAG TPA: hypothetical protein VMV69_10170 [Pirellulales bacterium]|nr:hypothetical protein [Pirellulales bacterium]
MTLVEQTREALAAVPTFAGGGHALSLERDGLRLTCDLTALDTLACEFTRLAMRADQLATASIEELKRLSETLAARLTYLLEPISPVEVDSQQCVVQLRSNPPRRDADRTSYYELLVRRGGELSLCRWTKQAGDVRLSLPAQVTREVLLRLVGDFAAVAVG